MNVGVNGNDSTDSLSRSAAGFLAWRPAGRHPVGMHVGSKRYVTTTLLRGWPKAVKRRIFTDPCAKKVAEHGMEPTSIPTIGCQPFAEEPQQRFPSWSRR